MKREKNDTMNFEEAMERLETIAGTLENGNASLDASIASFEEGMELIRLCHRKLQEAEQKVQVLVKGNDGEMVEMPFPSQEQEK